MYTQPTQVTRRDYAERILFTLTIPQTEQAINKLVAVMCGENTTAGWNPMATTRDIHPNTRFNTAGVRNYQSLAQGVSATVITLLNGFYTKELNALADDTITQQEFADTWNKGHWGTRHVPTTAAALNETSMVTSR